MLLFCLSLAENEDSSRFRFQRLDEIDTSNVANSKLAESFSTTVKR